MKGSFLLAGKEFLFKEYGEDIWNKAAEQCGFNPRKHILPIADISDKIVVCIAQKASEIIGIPLEELVEKFGRYWVTDGAKSLYGIFYKESNCAKQFLLNLNKFHYLATKNVPNAKPPFFEFWWEQRNVLTMKYISHRNFIDLAVGAVKGVGDIYDENLIVEKIPPDKIKVVFS